MQRYQRSSENPLLRGAGAQRRCERCNAMLLDGRCLDCPAVQEPAPASVPPPPASAPPPPASVQEPPPSSTKGQKRAGSDIDQLHESGLEGASESSEAADVEMAHPEALKLTSSTRSPSHLR